MPPGHCCEIRVIVDVNIIPATLRKMLLVQRENRVFGKVYADRRVESLDVWLVENLP